MTEDVQLCLAEARENMQDTISHLEESLRKIRAGKASPDMVAGVMVEAYGTQTPLNQVANVSVPDARTISIQPWDKSTLPEIERGIMVANIGLTPQNDGEFVRLNVPPLTEERRKDLAKQAKAEAEKAKVSLRNARKEANDFIKSLQKDGLSEDQSKDAEAQVQKLTDEFVALIDKYFNAKEAEILSI